VLATAANESPMQSSRDFDADDDAVAQVSRGLFELSFELGDQLELENRASIPKAPQVSRRRHAQANKANLLPRIRRPPGTSDEVAKALAASADNRTMVLALDRDHVCLLALDLLRDLEDLGLRVGDVFFIALDDDLRVLAGPFVNVDLCAGVLLDLPDRRATAPKDTSHGTAKDSEPDLCTGFLLELERLNKNVSKSRHKHAQGQLTSRSSAFA
jgi:hypothetical protein